jgi:hypothetical protein
VREWEQSFSPSSERAARIQCKLVDLIEKVAEVVDNLNIEDVETHERVHKASETLNRSKKG